MDIFDETLPEFFFKYIRLDRVIEILKNKELWFSSPKNFNDPFDCNINLIDFEPDENEIKKIINDKISGNRKLRRQEIQKNKRNSFRIKNQFSEQLEEIFYNSGVCCFSEINDNILLWAHYAENHKGICLKFTNKISDIATMTAKVNYKNRYEKVNFWKGKGGAINHLIFTKSKDWKYEKEIRAFTMLDNGKVDFDIKNLTEIIFGCKTDKNTISKIKRQYRRCIEDFSSLQLSCNLTETCNAIAYFSYTHR